MIDAESSEEDERSSCTSYGASADDLIERADQPGVDQITPVLTTLVGTSCQSGSLDSTQPQLGDTVPLLLQLNNEEVQQSIFKALKEDENFNRFLQTAPVSPAFVPLSSRLACTCLTLLFFTRCLTPFRFVLVCFAVPSTAIVHTTRLHSSLVLQGPSRLLLPPSTVLIEEVADPEVCMPRPVVMPGFLTGFAEQPQYIRCCSG